MVMSRDGGATWQQLDALDLLMTGNGRFRYGDDAGHVQPTLAAFSPINDNVVLAGGADSGVFISFDEGNTWKTVTDNSGDAANPQVPRPQLASFFRSPPDHGVIRDSIFLATAGRGTWRISYSEPAPPSTTPCTPLACAAAQPCVDACSNSRDVCLHEEENPKPTGAQCQQRWTACARKCRPPCTGRCAAIP
jgi:hypothetical protein